MAQDGARPMEGTLAHLFRRESGRVVATLMGVLGDLDRAEEILQQTLVTAMEKWPQSGIPDNPGGWLTTVARNRAVDVLRRDRRLEEKKDAIAWAQPGEGEGAPRPDEQMETESIADDQLRLMFMCCHPAVSAESQVALTLKLVAGLSTPEIARAFLVSQPTIAQRIVRAKRTIRQGELPFEVPGPDELPSRLASVLSVVYLIFNEGYTAREGEQLVRVELSEEAIRLASLLSGLLPDEAEVLGLLALMELQAARTRARTDADGNLVLLPDQDRSLWDRARIDSGLAHLQRAEALEAPGPYQVQAAIVGCHAAAPSWEATDWRRILALYDALRRIRPSPVVELNRAVALSMVDGPEAALAALDALGDVAALRDYHLYPATRADFLRRLGRREEAASEYQRALELTHNEAERTFLRQRLIATSAGVY